LQLQQAAAIKHKTSHARLAQLLQPLLAFVLVKQNANESCNSFIASFTVVVIPPLLRNYTLGVGHF